MTTTGRDLKDFAKRFDFSDTELAAALGYPRTENSRRLMRKYFKLKDQQLPPGVIERVKRVDTSDRHG